MPKIAYVRKDFSHSSRELIELSNAIIGEYQAQGFALTLRQLYYQLVSRGYIPNRQTEYKRLGSIVNDARLAGLIDWLAIEDRTRNLRSNGHWSSPKQIVDAAVRQYAIDKWADQPYHVEVWIEKDALIGVIEGVCRRLDIGYFSCRGYTSASEMWVAAQRLAEALENVRTPLILHLGDHDPSGLDMTRDIRDRLDLFTGGGVEVKRIALTMAQIEEYSPPPNPAKTTDSRYNAYIDEHGDESWELDALEPSVLAALIEDEVLAVRDEDEWDRAVAREQEHKGKLIAAAQELEL